MSNYYVITAIIAMAVTTYLTRCISLVLFRKDIKNKYIYSFLNYMPYGVLAALIVPSVFYSTQSLISAVCGTLLALGLAYFKRGLLFVSIGAVATVFIVERILELIY